MGKRRMWCPYFYKEEPGFRYCFLNSEANDKEYVGLNTGCCEWRQKRCLPLNCSIFDTNRLTWHKTKERMQEYIDLINDSMPEVLDLLRPLLPDDFNLHWPDPNTHEGFLFYCKLYEIFNRRRVHASDFFLDLYFENRESEDNE